MLSGSRAFQRSTSAETMTAILNDEPPAISQTSTNIPLALQRVVHRSLEKNPEQRFHSASDLAFALDALSDSGTSPAIAPQAKKKWRWIGVASGIVLLIALAAAGAWKYWPTPPPFSAVSIWQVTNVGTIENVAISADGRWLAEVKIENRLRTVWLRNIATNTENAGAERLPRPIFGSYLFPRFGLFVFCPGSGERHV